MGYTLVWNFLTVIWPTAGLTNLDLVSQDGQVRYLHDQMLGELLDVVGGCTPMENYPVVLTHHRR
jgi:hypothetical protein